MSISNSGTAQTSDTQKQVPGENVIEDIKNSAFVQGIEHFDHQVGGHGSERGSTLGLLKHKKGYVLKPAPRPGHREREVRFYEEIWKSSDSIIQQLQPYIPMYYGTTSLNMDGKDTHYIILEDITKDCAKPCVIDIKIGRQTWDPEATARKREVEEAKYPGTKPNLGFCIPGIQVHNVLTGETIDLTKDYGKALDEKTVTQAFRIFLNADAGLHRKLVSEFILQLDCVKNWFQQQNKYLLYSSSLLLVYDASLLTEANDIRETATTVCNNLYDYSRGQNQDSSIENAISNSSSLESKCNSPAPLNGLSVNNHSTNFSKSVMVKLIDFAHVFPANGATDNNYIHGLENVQRIFEELIKEAK